MKKVSSTMITVTQLAEPEKGDPGDAGAVGPWVYQSKWDDDPTGTVYYTGTASTDPYKNLCYDNGLWYACIKKFTRTSSSKRPSANTTNWKVMSNIQFIASEVILSEKGLIKLLATNNIQVVDEDSQVVLAEYRGDGASYYKDGKLSMELNADGIASYDENGEVVWSLGKDGVIVKKKQTTDNWTKITLVSLGSDYLTACVRASSTAGKLPTSTCPRVTCWEYSKGTGSTITGYDSGYTALGSSAPVAIASSTPITDGYYCQDTQAFGRISEATLIDEDDNTVYARMMYKYKDGYVVKRETVDIVGYDVT